MPLAVTLCSSSSSTTLSYCGGGLREEVGAAGRAAVVGGWRWWLGGRVGGRGSSPVDVPWQPGRVGEAQATAEAHPALSQRCGGPAGPHLVQHAQGELRRELALLHQLVQRVHQGLAQLGLPVER